MTAMTEGDTWRPTPMQARVLECATELGLRRNIVRVCKEAKVSRQTFYRWYREDAGFKGAWTTLWKAMIDRHLPGVLAAQITQAQAGDVPAGRLLAEIAGIVKNQVEQSGVLRIVYVNDWRAGSGPHSVADAPSGPAGDTETGVPVQPVASRPAVAEDDDGDVNRS